MPQSTVKVEQQTQMMEVDVRQVWRLSLHYHPHGYLVAPDLPR